MRVLKDGTDLNQNRIRFIWAARLDAEKNGAFIQGVLEPLVRPMR